MNDMTAPGLSTALPTETTDVLIVGTGFSGLVMALEILRRDLGSFVMLEKADEIGGTWRDNTYPGAACDIPSHLYSIASEPKADWSTMFAGHAEIEAYLKRVAVKHGLYDHVRFGRTFCRAEWDEAGARWLVATEEGETYAAKALVSAVGALHIPAIPNLAGLDRFEGAAFHSAQWDHGFDLAGKRVAVIGTGASAVQFIPEIAPKVARLDVYQRTAPWVLPKADAPFTEKRKALFGRLPGARALFRTWLYGVHEFRHLVFRGNRRMVKLAEGLALKSMRKAVRDPELRDKLRPNYRIGCKRILQSNDYYPALARPNVDVVTDAIAEVRPDAIVTVDGTVRPADAIIFGTGFHTTDSFDRLDIVGRGGVTLRQFWSKGLEANLGTTIAGFPNYFMLLGPNTGLGHNSVVLMIEAQAIYVGRLLKRMRRRKLKAIDVRREAQAAFGREMEERLSSMVWQAGGCRSWYQDENGRNTTLWPGTVTEFRRRLRRAGIEDFNTEGAA